MSFSSLRGALVRKAPGTGLVCAFSLIFVGSALALERVPFKANPADQAGAKAAVVKRADLGAGWRGGATKVDLSADSGCPDWKPKQSDLRVTGAAASRFVATGLVIKSEVHVFQSAAMVRLDWQRTVVPPRAFSCARETMANDSSDPEIKFVSFTRLSFPHVTSQTMAFRALLDVAGKGPTVRMMMDVVFVGTGRSELSLYTTAPFMSQAVVKAAEIRLARTLAARLPA